MVWGWELSAGREGLSLPPSLPRRSGAHCRPGKRRGLLPWGGAGGHPEGCLVPSRLLFRVEGPGEHRPSSTGRAAAGCSSSPALPASNGAPCRPRSHTAPRHGLSAGRRGRSRGAPKAVRAARCKLCSRPREKKG